MWENDVQNIDCVKNRKKRSTTGKRNRENRVGCLQIYNIFTLFFGKSSGDCKFAVPL